jgi:hypothetical protein
MNDDQPCARDDLEAIICRWDRYSVDDEGMGINLVSEGETDPYDVEEYMCFTCGEYFTPDKPKHFDDGEALARAWHAALEHLKLHNDKAAA